MTDKEIQKHLDNCKDVKLELLYSQDTRVMACAMMLNDEDLKNPDKSTFFNSIRDVIDLGYAPKYEKIVIWTLNQMQRKIVPIIQRYNSYKDTEKHPVEHLFTYDKSYFDKDGTLVHINTDINPIGDLFPDIVYKYEAKDNSPKDIKDLYILFMSFGELEIENHKNKYNCILPEILMRSTIDKFIKSDTSS